MGRNRQIKKLLLCLLLAGFGCLLYTLIAENDGGEKVFVKKQARKKEKKTLLEQDFARDRNDWTLKQIHVLVKKYEQGLEPEILSKLKELDDLKLKIANTPDWDASIKAVKMGKSEGQKPGIVAPLRKKPYTRNKVPLEDDNKLPLLSSNSTNGSLNVHFWEGFCGSRVEDLKRNIHFPYYPSEKKKIDRFFVQRYETGYGQRIFGYLHPPETGEFTFAVSCDDNCEVWLSTSERMEDIALIAHVGTLKKPANTKIADFQSFSSQISEKIHLQENKKYYVEVLHKQAAYKDHVLLAWLAPSWNRIRSIQSKHISSFISIDQFPADVNTYRKLIPKTKACQVQNYRDRNDSIYYYNKEKHDFTQYDYRQDFFMTPAASEEDFKGLLPPIDYRPSYVLDFVPRRYEGVTLVHESGIYPDDHTKLTHMLRYETCYRSRRYDSHNHHLDKGNSKSYKREDSDDKDEKDKESKKSAVFNPKIPVLGSWKSKQKNKVKPDSLQSAKYDSISREKYDSRKKTSQKITPKRDKYTAYESESEEHLARIALSRKGYLRKFGASQINNSLKKSLKYSAKAFSIFDRDSAITNGGVHRNNDEKLKVKHDNEPSIDSHSDSEVTDAGRKSQRDNKNKHLDVGSNKNDKKIDEYNKNEKDFGNSNLKHGSNENSNSYDRINDDNKDNENNYYDRIDRNKMDVESEAEVLIKEKQAKNAHHNNSMENKPLALRKLLTIDSRDLGNRKHGDQNIDENPHQNARFSLNNMKMESDREYVKSPNRNGNVKHIQNDIHQKNLPGSYQNSRRISKDSQQTDKKSRLIIQGEDNQRQSEVEDPDRSRFSNQNDKNLREVQNQDSFDPQKSRKNEFQREKEYPPSESWNFHRKKNGKAEFPPRPDISDSIPSLWQRRGSRDESMDSRNANMHGKISHRGLGYGYRNGRQGNYDDKGVEKDGRPSYHGGHGKENTKNAGRIGYGSNRYRSHRGVGPGRVNSFNNGDRRSWNREQMRQRHEQTKIYKLHYNFRGGELVNISKNITKKYSDRALILHFHPLFGSAIYYLLHQYPRLFPWMYNSFLSKCKTDGNLPLFKWAALSVVHKFMKGVKKKHGDKYDLSKIVNVEENHDVMRGDRYFLELELAVKNQERPVRLSKYIYRDLLTDQLYEPRNFEWNPKATVHVIVPVKDQGRWVQHFIDNMEKVYLETSDALLNVIIVDFNSSDIDIEKSLKRSKLKRYNLIQLYGPFERALGIQAGADVVKDENDILFTCDLHLDIPSHLIDSIRKHTIKERMAFAPIVYRLSCGYTSDLPYGLWEIDGYGLFAISKFDFDRIGGMNTKEFKTKWGGEDWEFLDRALGHGLEVERLRIPMFFHHYHSRKKMWVASKKTFTPKPPSLVS